MRVVVLLSFLALAGCSQRPATDAPAKASAEELRWTRYVCEDGRILRALYPDVGTAQVKLEGSTHYLKVGVSGSGARFIGDGLQWWIKGDEGMLASLKSGERIAGSPGVLCVPPAKAPVSPPEPGTPGGLSDDRTPLDERPAAAGSPQAAASVVETYYALVESGRGAEAAKLRSDGALYDVRPFDTLHAQIGGPGRVERVAGSLHVEVPVVLYGRYKTGAEYHASGKATLRRANAVPGASAEQLRWRIAKIDVRQAGR